MTPRTARRSSAASELVRRLLDIAIAGSALIATGPILVVAIILVRLTSGSPALFRQERIGLHRRPFTIYKLRTMRDEPDGEHRRFIAQQLGYLPPSTVNPPTIQKLTNDSRITPIGRWLRRTSVDELPQLINVLRDEMSIVGPRPALSWEAEMYFERHAPRFDVKPGLTGLWQVSGRAELSVPEALELDVQYVDRRSLGLDMRILLRTPLAVLRSHQTG